MLTLPSMDNTIQDTKLQQRTTRGLTNKVTRLERVNLTVVNIDRKTGEQRAEENRAEHLLPLGRLWRKASHQRIIPNGKKLSLPLLICNRGCNLTQQSHSKRKPRAQKHWAEQGQRLKEVLESPWVSPSLSVRVGWLDIWIWVPPVKEKNNRDSRRER